MWTDSETRLASYHLRYFHSSDLNTEFAHESDQSAVRGICLVRRVALVLTSTVRYNVFANIPRYCIAHYIYINTLANFRSTFSYISHYEGTLPLYHKASSLTIFTYKSSKRFDSPSDVSGTSNFTCATTLTCLGVHFCTLSPPSLTCQIFILLSSIQKSCLPRYSQRA
jgi:hypothetical protein